MTVGHQTPVTEPQRHSPRSTTGGPGGRAAGEAMPFPRQHSVVGCWMEAQVGRLDPSCAAMRKLVVLANALVEQEPPRGARTTGARRGSVGGKRAVRCQPAGDWPRGSALGRSHRVGEDEPTGREPTPVLDTPLQSPELACGKHAVVLPLQTLEELLRRPMRFSLEPVNRPDPTRRRTTALASSTAALSFLGQHPLRLRVERLLYRVEQHRQPVLVARVRRQIRRHHQLLLSVHRHLCVVALERRTALRVPVLARLPTPRVVRRPSRRFQTRLRRPDRCQTLLPPTQLRRQFIAPNLPRPSARPRPCRPRPPGAAAPRSRPPDAVPLPASGRSSSPCACSRSHARTTSTNSALKSSRCRRRNSHSVRCCGKLPAASIRNATSSSSFRASCRDEKTPVA